MSTNRRLSRLSRIIFGVVAINALFGALSLLFFPSRTDTLFFWKISPPINAALFGALYLGGALVVGWITYRGEWEPARFLIPVLVSAGIFISITTLLHIDRFTPGIKLGYWLLVYIGAPILALFIYFYHERPPADWRVIEPITRTTRTIAVGLGGVLLLLGGIMIIAPGFWVEQWPWATSPLMIRVFASWFSAFGVGLLWFYFDQDWRRLHLIATLMIAASGLDLLMIFIHRDDLNTTGLTLWVYCFHLALFGVVGLLFHWLQRQPAKK